MSLIARLFRPRPDPREDLRPLWHSLVSRARDPLWYREGGVADSVEGRFDMVTAVLALVLLRLEQAPETAAQQALLTELFVEDMDGQLRQSGVGDLVVGKHIGRLMGVLGGRLGALRDAVPGGLDALTPVIARNLTLVEGADPAAAARLAGALVATLDATPAPALLAGEFAL
ncbi:MAG: ubiquinol-cytochrome C chaperone family protein [Croceibacterium sp.]